MSKIRKYSIEELDRLSIDEFRRALKHPVSIVLDNIRSANNVGSFFRTCDAFRVEKIFLCGITATPPNKEIHKTALGATDSVEWKYYNETLTLVRELKHKGYQCFAIEQAENSTPLDALKPNHLRPPIALIFGNEVDGVDQSVIDNCDGCIEIPQWGTKHSLNVAVSAGIVLWELLRFFQPLSE
ncbi:MAG TPA: RNA methyltransferase [Salinivirgaceae bacterium]|nr:RNA methyltransferase [Salinivirgaceae bacterium]